MKTAIYCRLSEEDKNKALETDDSYSIQNQKIMLLQYAKAQGWEIYDIYSDDDYTGADRRRPEFNRLLKDAEDHCFDIILCKTQSRFTRELELVEKYIHGLFPVWGIRFISVVDNADTDNKGNKKSRQINGLVNEWYLEDMSENIRSVLTNRRQNGLHIGAFALYGYKKDPNKKGHLIIDEEAAAIVREVFVLFSEGYGKTAIARILNERKVPNPTEYKRLHGLRYKQPKMKNSTLWKYFAISDMLVNEIYIGNMVQGKYGSVSYKTKQNKPRPKSEWYIVKGTHEPIIDRELWDKVQTKIAQRTKPFSTGKIGLFAKKARCANCGYIMRSSKNNGKYFLQCPNHRMAKDACVGSFISVDRLEGMVIAELKYLCLEYLDKNLLIQNIRVIDNFQKQRRQILAELADYKKQAEEYSKGIRDSYMDKVRGIISESDFIDLKKSFTADKEQLEYNIQTKQKQLDKVENCISIGGNPKELVEQYINSEHLTRNLVENFIDSISVGKRIPGTKNVPVEIYWNF